VAQWQADLINVKKLCGTVNAMNFVISHETNNLAGEIMCVGASYEF
jgi:hypothetical protein